MSNVRLFLVNEEIVIFGRREKIIQIINNLPRKIADYFRETLSKPPTRNVVLRIKKPTKRILRRIAKVI